MQSANIKPISLTNEVLLKLDRSIDSNLIQLENIPLISLIFDTSKFVKFIDFNDLQPLNIDFELLINEELKYDKSIEIMESHN